MRRKVCAYKKQSDTAQTTPTRMAEISGGATHALSMLLNLALLISNRGFPFLAALRISLPICSPSRSQSVQMTRA